MGHLSYEFAMFIPGHFHQLCPPGVAASLSLAPRTFLPRNLLLCVLCVCSHASDTTVGWLSPYLQRQAQAQLQKKVKGPLELAGG